MAARYAELPVSTRMEAPLAAALKDLADQEGTNVSELIRRELRAAVARKRIALQAANDDRRARQ